MTKPADTARDWAVLAVTTSIQPAADRETAENLAAHAERLTAITRKPGGQWQPATDPDEPARYAFLVENDMQAGTLADYAKHWEAAQYSGAHISPHVRNWAGATFNIGIERLGVDEDSWLRYRLALGTETAIVTLDGLA
ncbi:hypothetical protein ACWD4N_33125 [Streptomyces sp. NPDC002586]